MRGGVARGGFAATVAFVVIGVLSGCGGVPANPETVAQMKYPVYDSIDSMTVDSDLVVRAKAVGTSEGRTVGTSDEGGAQFRNVELDVETVMFSRIKELPDPLVIEEIGWLAGKSVADSDLPWLKEGQRAMLFLRFDQTTGQYTYVAPQGRILLNSDGSVTAGGDHHISQVDAMNRLSLPALEKEVDTAAKRVTDNRVPRGDGMGDGRSR